MSFTFQIVIARIEWCAWVAGLIQPLFLLTFGFHCSLESVVSETTTATCVVAVTHCRQLKTFRVSNFRNWFDLIHPDDAKIFKDAVMAFYAENHGLLDFTSEYSKLPWFNRFFRSKFWKTWDENVNQKVIFPCPFKVINLCIPKTQVLAKFTSSSKRPRQLEHKLLHKSTRSHHRLEAIFCL